MIALVFDTETTDLVINRTVRLEKAPEMIEFYGCIVDLSANQILEELDLLIKPKNKIDETSKAFKAVGITNEMVKDAPSFENVSDKIRDIIKQAPLAIAHNVSFDKEMVDIEFARLGQNIEWPELLCTVESTVYLQGYRMAMNDLHNYLFGEGFTGAHRAKVDVQALVKCCVELHRREVI